MIWLKYHRVHFTNNQKKRNIRMTRHQIISNSNLLIHEQTFFQRTFLSEHKIPFYRENFDGHDGDFFRTVTPNIFNIGVQHVLLTDIFSSFISLYSDLLYRLSVSARTIHKPLTDISAFIVRSILTVLYRSYITARRTHGHPYFVVTS